MTHRCSCSFALALLAMVCIRPALAVDGSAAEVAGPPAGVAVPDGSPANDLLQRALDKQAQKQWKPAAELYREALEKFPDRLISMPSDATAVTRYRCAASIVRDRLSDWPSEALEVYKTLYGGAAASALARAPARDWAALGNVFEQFPGTEAGSAAGVRLLDGTLERGELVSAAALGRELLKMSSLPADDRAMVVCRTALASHWLGDDAGAFALAAQLRQSQPTVVGQLGGREGVLADLLDAALRSPAPSQVPGPSVAAATVKQFTMLFDEANYSGLTPFVRNASVQADRIPGEASDIVPAADNSEVFVQDGRCVYAFDAATAKPLPGWSERGQYRIDVPGKVHRKQLHLAVTSSVVLAMLGQPDRGLIRPYDDLFVKPAKDTTRLVCLDRDTGKLIWERALLDLPDPAGVIPTASLDGSPLVSPDGNSVLVCARRSQNSGFDDCYVVSLSISDGSYRWSTYVGGSTPGPGGRLASVNAAPALARFEGTVWVMSNLGTIAALDPHTGHLQWCNSYSRHSDTEAFEGFGVADSPASTQPHAPQWKQNPLLVCDGHVYAMPADSPHLFVLDSVDGTLQACLPTQWYQDASCLVGVQRNAVCLTGDHNLFVVDWTQAADDVRHGVLWRELNFTSEQYNVVSGRGVWSQDSILVPTQNRLYQFSARRQRIVSAYPQYGSFGENEGVGNANIAANQVLLTGPNGVTVLGSTAGRAP
jgi:outer membrane protein assembly factor BamB